MALKVHDLLWEKQQDSIHSLLELVGYFLSGASNLSSETKPHLSIHRQQTAVYF